MKRTSREEIRQRFLPHSFDRFRAELHSSWLLGLNQYRAEEMFDGIDMDMNRSTTAPTLRIREMQIGGE